MLLEARFLVHWRARGWTETGDRVAVACSGGVDSLVLLHLLRFRSERLGLRIGAAHYDHGMRAGSSDEADWLEGLTKAWRVPLFRAGAADPPRNEAEARQLRYAFFEELLRGHGFDLVLTAHHADDQAETVLFRILRGTGLEGLRGIPSTREPGIVRPLLPFRRGELEEYARVNGLRPRVDPSNLSLHFARNRLRHAVLPTLEREFPGSRESLLRLARNSSRSVEALHALLDQRLAELAVRNVEEGLACDRAGLRSEPDPVLGALVRRCVETLGFRLSEAGTGSAIQFIKTSAAPAQLDLPGPVRLNVQGDHVRFSSGRPQPARARRSPGENPAHRLLASLEIDGPGRGEGKVDLRGRHYLARWEPAEGAPPSADRSGSPWEWADLATDRLAFPLRLRSFEPGDRIRIRAGRKKLKKLLREARVDRRERRQLPLLVDAGGLVIWLMGQPKVADAFRADGPGGWRIAVKELNSG